MKLDLPLSIQILLVFFANLALLLAIFLFLFSSQFNLGWEALVYSPVGEKVQSLAFATGRQLEFLPHKQWNEVLAEMGTLYGAKFYVFDSDGHELAGDAIPLPSPVLQRIKDHPPFGNHHERLVLPPGPPPGLAFGFGHPPGRFFVHTSNPEMVWIGAMIMTDRNSFEPETLLAVAPNLWQTRLIMDMAYVGEALLAISILSLLVWSPFVFGITKALNQLTSATERIAEGKFDALLKVNRRDEIGRLAQAINTMSSRLSLYESGQRRFLGDIAHELCSPVGRLQIAMEMLEPICVEAEQEETLNDAREEVVQMCSLINELLAFSKAGIRGPELAIVPVELDAVLRKVAATCNSELQIQSPLICLGDELLLERAFGNIVRNADRYAANSGPISIVAERLNGYISVKFADNGPGVHPDAIELLGEPFYRPEASRNRSSGGMGLGLAIVKTCIEACGGRVTLKNRQPTGLEVEIQLQGV